MAQATGIDPVLMAGTILSGAMFGDNLSIISDTTIAATRSQGCEMKDKFRENFKIAAPAAIAVILLYLTLGSVGESPANGSAIELFKVMPYLLILGLALSVYSLVTWDRLQFGPLDPTLGMRVGEGWEG